MGEKYFTSDLHLGDDRIGINGKPNLFYRPFKSVTEQNLTLLAKLQHIKPEDELYIVGDLLYDYGVISLLKLLPKCKKYLIIGNYDEDHTEELKPYFDEIKHSMTIKIGEFTVELNHYPKACVDVLSRTEGIDFAITGHIHGLWKVQKNLINVSTDAWHFSPVSETEILFCYNAMTNFYDVNVFPYNY
jgi:calcineurin-like phosphoesterase family protein